MPAANAATTERLDLHCHSVWSSGFCTAPELVRWASMADVRTLAITDHHHVEAFAEAAGLAAQLGVALIPAIELDCAAGERRVDLLGYWIDPAAPSLATFTRRWPEGVRHLLTNEAALARLAEALGVRIDRDDLFAIAAPREPSLYHLFVLFVRQGWAPTLGTAFRRWEELRRSGRFPRLERPRAPVAEGAAAIRAAGGIVSLAHPGLVHEDATVRRLVIEGLVDAIETPYGGYWAQGEQLNAAYGRLAEELGIPTSAGSDYHAYPFSPLQLGVEVPARLVERLRRARPYSR